MGQAAISLMMKAAKKYAIFALKLMLAAVIIGWLLKQQRLNLSTLSAIRGDFRCVSLVLLSSLSVFVGLLLMSWRFQLILGRRGLQVSFCQSLRLTLIGSFTGAVLPGLVGGDVVKAAYLCGITRQNKADAVAAVLADRLVGIYALVLLATLAMPVAFGMHALFLTTRLAAGILILLVGLTLTAWLASLDMWRRFSFTRNLYDRGPAPARNLVSALHFYAKSPRLIIASIFLSLANHFLVVVSFVTMAVLLNDPLPMVAHFVINPLAMSTNALPVTPGGLGIAESAFSFLFERAGSPNGALIGLLGRLIAYAVFAIGGTIALVGSGFGASDELPDPSKVEVAVGPE